MRLRSFCLTTFILLCATLPTPAEDWPQFRGPTGQGHAKDVSLPIEWSTTKNVTWKTPLDGEAWSSPVIVDGQIYLTNAVPMGNNHSLRTLSLDVKTGKVLWDVEVFTQQGTTATKHRKNSHASPTPIVLEDRLYVHFGYQGIACMSLKGEIQWKNREFRYPPVHGNGGTPVIVENAIIFSCDGARDPFVLALDRRTGKQLWKTPRNTTASRKFSFATPLVITVDDQKQVILPASDLVAAYDPKTGNEIWRVRYVGYSVIPRPVYGNGLVYVCTGYGTPSLLSIDPSGKGDVTTTHLKWRTNRNVPHTSSVLLVGGELFMVSDRGTASCLDAKTGKVHWSERLRGGYSASPIYVAGKIYFLSEEGVGTVIEAGKTFKELARNDLEERALASYAVADGALFIRTAKHLYRVEKK